MLCWQIEGRIVRLSRTLPGLACRPTLTSHRLAAFSPRQERLSCWHPLNCWQISPNRRGRTVTPQPSFALNDQVRQVMTPDCDKPTPRIELGIRPYQGRVIPLTLCRQSPLTRGAQPACPLPGADRAICVIRIPRFELGTSLFRTRRATRLRHTLGSPLMRRGR